MPRTLTRPVRSISSWSWRGVLGPLRQEVEDLFDRFWQDGEGSGSRGYLADQSQSDLTE